MAITLSDERRTLKTLQVSNDGKLIGSENQPGKKMLQTKIVGSKKPLVVYKDKPTLTSTPVRKTREMCIQASPSHTDTEVQTEETGCWHQTKGAAVNHDAHNDSGVGAGDIDQEAYDLMVRDPIPESYWRELAEERRLSLAEALAENEMLHQSMEEIKEENANLSLLAGQAEHLASVLNDVLGEGGNSKSDPADSSVRTDTPTSDTPTTDTPTTEITATNPSEGSDHTKDKLS